MYCICTIDKKKEIKRTKQIAKHVARLRSDAI